MGREPARQLSLFDTTATDARPDAYTVRVSHRARRLSIKVHPRGRVEVVVPRRASPREVESFVAANREWIARTRAAFVRRYGEPDTRLPDRIDLALTGERLAVRYLRTSGRTPDETAGHSSGRSLQPPAARRGRAADRGSSRASDERRGRSAGAPATGGASGSVRAREGAEGLVLSGATGDQTACRAALRRWLLRRAKRELAPRLDTLAAETGIGYARCQVRIQRSCWGSRSSSGTISLNACLLFLEPALVRYLLVHELCHGVHMNHSRRYWRRVARHVPDYRELDRRLGDSWGAMPGWLES